MSPIHLCLRAKLESLLEPKNSLKKVVTQPMFRYPIHTSACMVATCLAVSFLFTIAAQAQRPKGGPNAPEQKLLAKYDADGDGLLNTAERAEARQSMGDQGNRRPRRRRGPAMEGKPGPRVSPSDVKNYPDAELYDRQVLRTLFLEFENADWEKELEAFKSTDVEVPATMTVDGKVYPNVGVSFRGASSYFSIPTGLKRSFNLSIDLVDKDQRLYGYKTLNLLNFNGDPSLMSSALYSVIAGKKIPTPKVNFVKVVINGESWGLYASSQQFNKVFVKQHYDSSKGARWKVSGSPQGDGGLRYLGDDVQPYRQRFEIKSKDQAESWNDLIHLCQVLNETPDDQLKEKLEPILNVEGALWFLAVDVALANSDGYWTRASDYSIYQDTDGKFHILPHDMNEAFKMRHGRGPGGPPPGGPGGPPQDGRGGPPQDGRGGPPQDGRGGPPQDGRGGPPQDGRGGPPQDGRGGPPQDGRGGPPRFLGGPPRGGAGGGGPTLDPMIGLTDDRMPLRSRLLNVPEYQQQYLQNLRDIAQMLEWENLGPQVAQMRDLIEDEVKLDTRKLSTIEAFRAATDQKAGPESQGLKAFSDQRSAFLLNHGKVKSVNSETDK